MTYDFVVDRRFWSEIQHDLSGKGMNFSTKAAALPYKVAKFNLLMLVAPLAAVEPIPEIPKDSMDVGNGYYDIDNRKIYQYDGTFKRNVGKCFEMSLKSLAS